MTTTTSNRPQHHYYTIQGESWYYTNPRPEFRCGCGAPSMWFHNGDTVGDRRCDAHSPDDAERVTDDYNK